MLGNRRQIAVFKRNPAEARLEVGECVFEIAYFCSQSMVPHQGPQIALACDKAHNRNRPRASAGFHQLHQLRCFAIHEGSIARTGTRARGSVRPGTEMMPSYPSDCACRLITASPSSRLTKPAVWRAAEKGSGPAHSPIGRVPTEAPPARAAASKLAASQSPSSAPQSPLAPLFRASKNAESPIWCRSLSRSPSRHQKGRVQQAGDSGEACVTRS